MPALLFYFLLAFFAFVPSAGRMSPTLFTVSFLVGAIINIIVYENPLRMVDSGMDAFDYWLKVPMYLLDFIAAILSVVVNTLSR
jgi:hypothetical protein